MKRGDEHMVYREQQQTPDVTASYGVHPNPSGPQDELAVLMSLALDEQLDAHDAARLEAWLAAEPDWVAEWQTWQEVDAMLHEAAYVSPPLDFVAQVERRLVLAERRRQLWVGIAIGVVMVLLWGSALIGAFSAGALLLSRQGVWLSGVIHGIAFWWAGLTSGLDALWSMIGAFATTREAQVLFAGYVGLAAVVLALWLQFLRRSLRVSEVMAG